MQPACNPMHAASLQLYACRHAFELEGEDFLSAGMRLCWMAPPAGGDQAKSVVVISYGKDADSHDRDLYARKHVLCRAVKSVSGERSNLTADCGDVLEINPGYICKDNTCECAYKCAQLLPRVACSLHETNLYETCTPCACENTMFAGRTA